MAKQGIGDGTAFGSTERTLVALADALTDVIANVESGRRKATVGDFLVLQKLKGSVGGRPRAPRELRVDDPWDPSRAPEAQVPKAA